MADKTTDKQGKQRTQRKAGDEDPCNLKPFDALHR
jgi:hypothetical protein